MTTHRAPCPSGSGATPDPRVVAAHARAEAAGDDGYLDPDTGLFVLTAAALAARGTCCDSGCRHCPYG